MSGTVWPRTQADLMGALDQLGFEACIPRTCSWHRAFVARSESRSIIVLFGKRGIDLKLYDVATDFEFDAAGRLATAGGRMVRNYYSDDAADVHRLVLEIAQRFVADEPIDESLLAGQGTPWFVRKREYACSRAPLDVRARREMQALYDEVTPWRR
ncbi:hypothetical protein RBXJA2T_01920 [Rubrivivax benzoatilyticus JA2 = ATCC BAA-35]|uniref:hypothetical protein n=1 Tax=Rubrivivax benzoatilyticus TaxID=316997 RepID=UPI00020A4C25|nr:hypothetical protein [Rubrivivax benzoatilyticus]EGJ09051.1 hypothetical protein RBXJA2T_01920 [Rubrivivax benzoatilyticus JA2 = ATCC BAA-35]